MDVTLALRGMKLVLGGCVGVGGDGRWNLVVTSVVRPPASDRHRRGRREPAR